jgi:hypothetical protein
MNISPSNHALSLETFLHAIQDMERTRFEILGGLQKVRSNFHHNKIYPDLAMLIDLHAELQTIANNADTLQRKHPRTLKEIDFDERKLIYNDVPIHDENFASIRELIDWAMPYLQTAMEEGATMFEFVEENLSLEVVGILPSYLEEGYAFVPDNIGGILHVIKYEVSIFTGASEQYRSLKTSLVKSMQRSAIVQPAQTLKLELVQEYPELPNPATYSFDTDLDFPFQETILPVAKRRLLRHLFS